MNSVTILQSAADLRPDWVGRCMASVEDWAESQGYAYQCIGDELFDWVPRELRNKLRDRKPILADIARLRWMESELATRAGPVVWVDADTLAMDATWRVPDSQHTFFGEECWVQQTSDGGWRAFLSPHNAFMGFTAASPVLGFLAYLSESIIERADAGHIAPQMIGPKLLKALNNFAQFPLVPEAGALSPPLLAECVRGHGGAHACYVQQNRPELALINLCSSLNREAGQISLINTFLDRSAP